MGYHRLARDLVLALLCVLGWVALLALFVWAKV